MAVLRKMILYLTSYFMRIVDWINIGASRKCRAISQEGVKVEHIRIPSRDNGRYIRAIRYTPIGETAPLPVHLNWHASGWMLKRLGLDRHMCIKFARELRCIVLDCDYRKGPENQFPAAHNDTEDAVFYVHANPKQFDVNRVTVGGSSAGACMALSLSARLGEQRVKGCFAMYPVTRLLPVERIHSSQHAISTTFRSGIVISDWAMKVFTLAYFTPKANMDDPRISPLLDEPSRFPKHVLLVCGEADTLYKGCRDFMVKITGSEDGTNESMTRTFISIPNEAHEFNNFASVRESVEWRDKVEDSAIQMIRAAWNAAA